MSSGLTVIAGGFDPATVPLYPVLRAEIRLCDDGTGFVGLVDDRVVGEDGGAIDPVRLAIIEAAAAIASRRLGRSKAIRVRGVAPDGQVFRLVVTAEGDVYDVTEEADNASPVSGKKRQLSTPDAASHGRRAPHPLLIIILAIPIGVIVVLVTSVLPHHSTTTMATPPGPTQLPVIAPAGYAPVARWSTPVGSSSNSAGLAADADRVFVAAGNAVSTFSSATGVRQWSTDLGALLSTGPTLTRIAGTSAVVAATSTQLVALDPATGAKLGGWNLDSAIGTRVQITATGPVVTGQTNLAQIVVDGQLVTRALPAGALPVGPGPGGSMIAVTHDRVFASTSAAVSGAGTPITAPAGDVAVAGWTGARLILAFTVASTATDTDGGVSLVGFSVPSTPDGVWRRVWATSTIPASTSSGTGLPLATGPSGLWGIYGSTVVDLSTGATVSLGETWSTTTAIGDGLAFGTGDGSVLSTGPGGVGRDSVTEPASIQVVAPQAVAGSAAYLVTTGGGPTAALYALTPDPTTVPTVQGSPFPLTSSTPVPSGGATR